MKKDWHESTQCGDCGRVLLLLNEGADINSLDRYSQTALINAACRGDTPLVQLLVKHGAELNHTAKYRLTALLLAVINGHAEIITILHNANKKTM
ncbi:MAG: ankyrin repeat domain-containing protein [Gammaproteobacteria bacterium]|nr:ankyrin repeat domain-containing protein [Gammaproteobacteria bacterium]MCF6258668.1 ankyrin repeat domain-containing protein [Gammaproteobacteria bacterium]